MTYFTGFAMVLPSRGASSSVGVVGRGKVVPLDVVLQQTAATVEARTAGLSGLRKEVAELEVENFGKAGQRRGRGLGAVLPITDCPLRHP